MKKKLVGAALTGALLLAPAAAWPGAFLVQPGPEGADSAPYGFLPNLVRGDYTTLYAFSEVDAHQFEIYLQFPLPAGVPAPGEQVAKAELYLTYAFDFTGFGGTSNEPGLLRLHAVQAPWSEAALAWVNRPPIGPVLATIPDITGFRTLVFDVTTLVRAWTAGAPNHGVAITSPTARVMGFHSFEATSQPAALRPFLVIQTAPGSFADADADGIEDGADVCPTVSDPGQEDRGGIGPGSAPDGIGDACQCGDVNDDGVVSLLDAVTIQRALLTPPAATLSAPDRCDVGGSAGCTLADAVLIRRALLSPPSAVLEGRCVPAPGA